MSRYIQCHPSIQQDALICAIVEAARSFTGLHDANAYLQGLCGSGGRCVQVSANHYRCGEHHIDLGKRFLMAGHAKCLMALTDMELTCLPQGIAVVWLDNDEDMLLITRLPSSEGLQPIPLREHRGSLPHSVRQAFLADIDRLLADGRTLADATAPGKWWYLPAGDGRILLSECKLASVPGDARTVYRRRVLEALGLEA